MMRLEPALFHLRLTAIRKGLLKKKRLNGVVNQRFIGNRCPALYETCFVKCLAQASATPASGFSSSSSDTPFNVSLEHAGLTPHNSDKSSSLSIVWSRSILHKRYNDDGDRNHNRRCQSDPMRGWLLPMPVSRKRLRSEKNACCPRRCIDESLVGSLGLGHQPRKTPYCLCSSARASRSSLFTTVLYSSDCTDSPGLAVQY